MGNPNEVVQAAIRFDKICKRIHHANGKSITILNGVSGEVERGKIVTLVGPSGSGKSTLLSLCNLLLTPDEGEVFVEGREVRNWNIPQLRRYVGLVFQSPTMFPGTVEENIAMGAKLTGRPMTSPAEWLSKVQLSSELLSNRAEDLSGGQKQRVALARVLANEPNILLLDEVTSALDPTSAHEIEELLLQLHREQNLTMLWVTHNLEQARRVGDETWLFMNGERIEAQPTELFFSHPKEEATLKFLEGGYTQGDVT